MPGGNTRGTAKKAISFEEVVKKVDAATLTTEVKNIFKVMIDCMKTLASERDSKVAELENELRNERVEHEAKINSMESTIQSYKSDNDNLRSQISKINNAHDELEAYGRRESLIFSGDKIKEFEPNENCVTLAKNLINDVLKVPIDPIISTAHRMGKPPAPDSTAKDKRAIIVKFCRRDDSFLVLNKARSKNSRVAGLYVNESLTPTRSKILYVLRQAKNLSDSPITGTSTLNGRIFAHHKPSSSAPENARSQKTELNTMEKLKEFCDNFIKRPLERFLDNQISNSR